MYVEWFTLHYPLQTCMGPTKICHNLRQSSRKTLGDVLFRACHCICKAQSIFPGGSLHIYLSFCLSFSCYLGLVKSFYESTLPMLTTFNYIIIRKLYDLQKRLSLAKTFTCVPFSHLLIHVKIFPLIPSDELKIFKFCLLKTSLNWDQPINKLAGTLKGFQEALQRQVFCHRSSAEHHSADCLSTELLPICLVQESDWWACTSPHWPQPFYVFIYLKMLRVAILLPLDTTAVSKRV